MTETNTFSNDYLRKVISSHFAEQNKRMTNLQKARKEELLSIIAKYNIGVPEEPKKESKSDIKEEPYELKKEGKAHVLIYKDKEYRIGDEFIIHISHSNCLGNNISTQYGLICNITPKQIHYKNSYYPNMYKPKTNDFIVSYLKGNPIHVYYD